MPLCCSFSKLVFRSAPSCVSFASAILCSVCKWLCFSASVPCVVCECFCFLVTVALLAGSMRASRSVHSHREVAMAPLGSHRDSSHWHRGSSGPGESYDGRLSPPPGCMPSRLEDVWGPASCLGVVGRSLDFLFVITIAAVCFFIVSLGLCDSLHNCSASGATPVFSMVPLGV